MKGFTTVSVQRKFHRNFMVYLSDLHGVWFGKNHNVMIKAIEGFQPDMVLMTGDMADSGREGMESCPFSRFASVSAVFQRTFY